MRLSNLVMLSLPLLSGLRLKVKIRRKKKTFLRFSLNLNKYKANLIFYIIEINYNMILYLKVLLETKYCQSVSEN